MGEVIRKDAAVADIFADASSALRMAQQKGGETQRLAEERLATSLTLANDIAAKLRAAEEAEAPLLAALEVEDQRCDKLLGRISDEAWNALGRPAFDAAFDLLFPGGLGYYADGSTDEQPERMDLLAELLRSGVHPRLPAQVGTQLAAQVSDAAISLRSKVEAARPASARVQLLSRMYTAIARSTQFQLVGLKRMYKAVGVSEAEIHTIIPDRPARATARAKKDPATPAS
jgi:hypothetical protein